MTKKSPKRIRGFRGTTLVAASDAKDGQSTATLDVGALAETHMFRVVRSAEDPENEDLTAAGANVIVVINSAANLYN